MENERKRILELVKQGVISTEEALTLLEKSSKKEGDSAASETIREAKGPDNKARKEYDYSQGWNTNDNPYKGPHAGHNPHNHQKSKTEQYWHTKNKQYRNEDKMKNVMNDLSQASEKITSFLSNAWSQVKDMPFPFLTSTKIERDFVYHDTTLSILKFEIANGNVEFKPSENDDIRIQAMIKLFKEYPEEEAMKIFFDKTVLQVDEESLRFESKSKQIVTNLIVHLPRRVYDYVSLKLLNGNIHVGELEGRDLFMKTTNGNISVGTLHATLAEIESINGNVRIQNGVVRDVSLKTFNGSASVKGDFYSTNLQTKNGNITYTLLNQEATYVKGKTGAGSIEIIVPKEISLEGRLHTNLGKIDLHVKDAEIIDSKTEAVNKSIIFTKWQENSPSPLKIEAEATTGTVKVREASSI